MGLMTRGVRLVRTMPPRILLAAGALVVMASRLPFLGAGYGTDGDAWLTANAAERIAATGRYVMSRVPGHPVQELAYAAAPIREPLALNLLTALMSVVAFVAFAAAARRFGLRDYLAAALALVFVPVIYVTSTTSMDYVWALAFLMLSLWCARSGRPVLAGVMLGLAAGCRLTSILLAAPYLLMLPEARHSSRRLRAIVGFVGAAAAVTALCYLPVWLSYRSSMPEVYETAVPVLIIVKHATVDVWGLAGLAAIVVALVIAPWRLVRHGRPAAAEIAASSPADLAAWAIVVAMVGVVFLRLPHEPGYLIPAIPFVLLLLSRVLPRSIFRAVCLALLVSPFVFGVYTAGRLNSPQPSRSAVALPGSDSLLLDPLKGAILADHSARVASTELAARVILHSENLPARSVVVTGSWLWWVKQSLPEGSGWPEFVWTLSAEELAGRLRAGQPVYYVPGTEAGNLATVPLPADLADRRPQNLFGR